MLVLGHTQRLHKKYEISDIAWPTFFLFLQRIHVKYCLKKYFTLNTNKETPDMIIFIRRTSPQKIHSFDNTGMLFLNQLEHVECTYSQ